MEEKMQEKLQMQDEISLMDIIRLFIRKLKWIILVALIAVIAGASFGYLKTRDEHHFGATIAFYVNPQKDENSDQESEYSIYGSYGENVMDNMVKLLSSELFAETLMLDPQGLPDDAMIAKIRAHANGGDAKADALMAKVTKARQTLDLIASKKTALDLASEDLSNARTAMYDVQTAVNNAWADLGKGGTPSRIIITTRPEEETYNSLWDDYQKSIIAYNTATQTQKDARSALIDARSQKSNAFDEALKQWRTDYSVCGYYGGELANYRWAATYSYRSPSDGSDMNFARSFFYVNISKSGKDAVSTEAFAREFRERIIEYVPMFIEEIMPIPGGYLSTNCQRITRNDHVYTTNADYAKNTAIKYAILLAAVAVVITCVVIVIVDRSDKRLRSVEQITEKFNLPVLGVIPNIHIEKDKNTTEDKE